MEVLTPSSLLECLSTSRPALDPPPDREEKISAGRVGVPQEGGCPPGVCMGGKAWGERDPSPPNTPSPEHHPPDTMPKEVLPGLGAGVILHPTLVPSCMPSTVRCTLLPNRDRAQSLRDGDTGFHHRDNKWGLACLRWSCAHFPQVEWAPWKFGSGGSAFGEHEGMPLGAVV